jgi:hypothetical protein
VVPVGEEALFLAPLPLATLPLRLENRLALQRLGVQTLGDYARLPANATVHRYGEAGKQAQRLARGIDDTPLRPRRPKPAARVELAFDWEETELDRLTFALKILADQLAARLATLDDEGGEEEAQGAAGDEYADPLFADPPFADPPSTNASLADPSYDDPDLAPSSFPAAAPAAALVANRATWSSSSGASGNGGGAAPSSKGKEHTRGGSAARYAAEALRVTWRLAGGETREALVRLAEPASSAAAFREHLRWHAEGLERLLGEQLAGDRPLATEYQEGTRELRYEPIERRLAVAGIALEAIGIQVPSGVPLKLLAGPLQWSQGGGAHAGSLTRLDPVTRARQARQAIARLQARWGELTVWQVSPTLDRLPEHAYRVAAPAIDLQVADPLAEERAFGGSSPVQKETKGPPRVRKGRACAGEPAARSPAGSAAGWTHDEAAPLAGHPPLWLISPPEPVRVLKGRQKGGHPRLVRLGHVHRGARDGVGDKDEDEGEEGGSPPSSASHAPSAPPSAASPTTPTSLWTPGWPAQSRPGEGGLRNVKREGIRIVKFGGPWKLVDPTRLTTGEPVRRDYYQVETEDGRAYLVYWDRTLDAWFLQGEFD